jgi:hypothetical protein
MQASSFSPCGARRAGEARDSSQWLSAAKSDEGCSSLAPTPPNPSSVSPLRRRSTFSHKGRRPSAPPSHHKIYPRPQPHPLSSTHRPHGNFGAHRGSKEGGGVRVGCAAVAPFGGNQSPTNPGHGRCFAGSGPFPGGKRTDQPTGSRQAHRRTRNTRAVSYYNQRRGISRPLPKLHRAGRRKPVPGT